MAGLPGSGKTTLSRALTDRGFVRLCPDEEMFRRHGVYGVDFPRGTFPALERPILEEISLELREQLQAGKDVVVDHGFWTPDDRARWRATATEAGATSVPGLPGGQPRGALGAREQAERAARSRSELDLLR
ncbi:AAA family ATPase [Streptomyces sp. NPDC059558]|uniref:AAA family ATPase n=1 Tax=Streptomyces sp. NPDC059558 TaxID=3346864 RepID=UPI003689D61A